MNNIIMIGTQLTGGQQTVAKWVLFGCIGAWIILAIITKLKGKDE